MKKQRMLVRLSLDYIQDDTYRTEFSNRKRNYIKHGLAVSLET